MISRACKLAAEQYGWRIFYAYADPKAGEIGTVYQACNWLCLGVAVGRTGGKGRWRLFDRRAGKWRSDRLLSRRKLKLADLRAHPEWIAEWTPDKGRYVWFEGTRREKRDLKHALKYAPQAYPKRTRGPAILLTQAQSPGFKAAFPHRATGLSRSHPPPGKEKTAAPVKGQRLP
jgi:hypothetical protein